MTDEQSTDVGGIAADRLRSLIEIGSGFHGDLTGRENIFLNGSILGMSQKELADKASVSGKLISDIIKPTAAIIRIGLILRLVIPSKASPNILDNG